MRPVEVAVVRCARQERDDISFGSAPGESKQSPTGEPSVVVVKRPGTCRVEASRDEGQPRETAPCRDVTGERVSRCTALLFASGSGVSGTPRILFMA